MYPAATAIGLNAAEFQHLAQTMHVLSNAASLKLLRFLESHGRTLEAIAACIDASNTAAEAYLSELRKAGLVNLHMIAGEHYYQLKPGALTNVADLVARAALPEPPAPVVYSNDWIAELDIDADAAAVLDSHFNGAELLRIPNKLKAMIVVVNYLATKFELGRVYTEFQVNAILRRHHDDVATLRRALVDHKHLQRDRRGNRYWLHITVD
jgi:hypothetical protein